MKGKKLIVKTLDLLVEIAEHCKNLEKPEGSSKCKCANCELNWSFSLGDHGCFFVETIDNNEKFIDDLTAICKYHNIEYKDKLNKVADIFVTECED